MPTSVNSRQRHLSIIPAASTATGIGVLVMAGALTPALPLPAARMLREPPLRFIEDRGRPRGGARFYAPGRNASVFLTDEGILFSLQATAIGGGRRPAQTGG